MHSRTQVSGMPFGHAGDQIGGPRQGQRGRKATDHHDDLPPESELRQGFIDRPLLDPAPRYRDMPAGRISGRRDLALAQRVPLPHDADEAIAEQCLRTQFRTGGLADDAGFQVDGPVTQGRAIPVRLWREAEPHAGRFLADAVQ